MVCDMIHKMEKRGKCMTLTCDLEYKENSYIVTVDTFVSGVIFGSFLKESTFINYERIPTIFRIESTDSLFDTSVCAIFDVYQLT